MKNTVLTFITLTLFASGGAGVFASDAGAADSTYWQERIESIEESALSENEKAFKLKQIRKYMGNSSEAQMLVSLASPGMDTR